MLHQTLGRGEDGSDLIGWAGRPKVTFEEDRDARTRTSGATREKSDGPCRQRETERLHRGGHLIPITPEGSLRVPFTSTLIDQCPSEGSRDDARCRPLSRERRRSHMTSVFSASPTLIQGRRPAGRCRSSGQLADFRRRSALGRLHTDHTAPYRMAVITERAALRAIISTLNPRLGRYVEAASRRTKSCIRAKSVHRRASDG